ncbi:MAG: YraN family protein [Chloroflexota bacterium]|nr:YraN family protein [Chloroflexota bacterium]
MTDARRTLGQRGEAIARDHLLRKGYTLLAQNWRCPLGELDLVMRQGGTVVIVEVRTRRAGTEAGFASVDARKQAKLARLAQAFMSARELDDAPCRVDVVAVRFNADGLHGTLSHAEDVLEW